MSSRISAWADLRQNCCWQWHKVLIKPCRATAGRTNLRLTCHEWHPWICCLHRVSRLKEHSMLPMSQPATSAQRNFQDKAKTISDYIMTEQSSMTLPDSYVGDDNEVKPRKRHWLMLHKLFYDVPCNTVSRCVEYIAVTGFINGDKYLGW